MSVKKAKEAYNKILGQLSELARQPMSIENWTAVCAIMAKGLRVATIAKEEDVSTLPFYRAGLKYLRREPKEVSVEQALENLDDSNEFYSLKEQQVILDAFSGFADRLEEWAETMDLQHGVYWRRRENTKPWDPINTGYIDEDPPPYFGWVLVNINRIKGHFEPMPEPYANEVNCNPYNDKLFAYHQARQRWRFHPAFIEKLILKLSDVPEENPLVGKYLEWGAASPEEIPGSLLKVKDGAISKELFEKNLAIRDEDYEGLFKLLNGNASAYLLDQETKVRDAIDEYLDTFAYENSDPVDVINEKLDEIEKGLGDLWLADDYRWHPVLAAALRLPRYTIYYFDWARCYVDEGPDEPGLVYQLRDGTRQQVHYEVRESKWWDKLDIAEWKIQNIIDRCKNLAIKMGSDAVLNQWYDIQTAWKKCARRADRFNHSVGDTDGFAAAFSDGLLKLSVILPHLKKGPEKTDDADTRYAAVEKLMAVYAKMPPSVIRFQFICSTIKDGVDAACNGDADLNVWESAWLTAALQLLAENPCPDGCDLIDRQNLYRAILPAFSKIIALFSLVQNEDPDMLADELDYFYQDVNEVMRQNWSSDPRTGEKGVVLTPSFVTRDGINGDWEFNDVYIRRLASHCSAKDAIKRFKEMEVSDSDRSTINAVGADKSEAGCGSLSEHLLFVQAIDAASGLVSSLEVADDVGVKVVVASEEVFGRAIQPFFGTYFRPYTRYPKKLEKDKALGLDIQSDITQLMGLIERVFTRISKIKGVELPLQEAKGLWKKICTLYDFRMKNPFVRLSRKAQEDYADLFIQIGSQLAACSKEDNEVRMSEQSGQSAPAEMAKAVVAELKPELEALKRQGENTNRNVLRCGGKLVNEVAQVRKNTQTLLREQCVDEELTAHDNEAYKPRYEGVDLEMLDAARDLVDKGNLNRSSAAQRVFKQYAGKTHGFSSLENFRTIFYRYYKNVKERS